MKFLIVFVALFAIALASPLSQPQSGADALAQTLRSDSDVGPESFKYAYETSNGIQAAADGQVKNIGTEAEAIVVKGQFSYVADDGQTYSVSYIADENGFQPQGAHLPVA